ncbi:MAG: ATP-dependent Clp protease ATP-binding subunit ClpA [Pseudomonadota bacterium]
MLSKDLEHTLSIAFDSARRQRHEFMTVEHLLLALTDNAAAREVLMAVDCDIDRLRGELESYISETTPTLNEQDHRETQPTLGFQRVLQRAVFNVQSSGREEVTGANVLVAIFGEQESQAAFILSALGIQRLDVINYISHGITEADDFLDDEDIEEAEAAAAEGSDEPLEQFTVNLNQLASEGKIDPLIGRDEEVERTVQILCRRRKNNPLLVGEAGVGKTAIAEGLAKRIVDGDVPELLKSTRIFSLDLGALVAGTKYRGDFEKRLKGVIKSFKKIEDVVVFIDEIHTMIGAGSASGGVMDASNLLKPALSSGDLRVIGATTYQEFRGIFEKDRALTRRFQKIDVQEPTPHDATEILKGLKSRFEDHHDVAYSDEALATAVELSSRYIHDRFLPDKAIDVIDEAGAKRRITGGENRQIEVADIEQVVASMARIPPKQVSSDDRDTLRRLEDNLNRVVFGQPEAIHQLATAIKLARSGLREGDKPIGSFLFSGPTGVGKTEVTRQLAMSLGIELVRFDMSEYMERHTVSRLIGAPPGYVGYDQGGLLTEAVTKTPHCVLLLDEIEKAHPDVFNLLLQVMDHGKLTDNNGRSADFRNVILVMTSNAGAEALDRRSMGFVSQDHTSDGNEALKRLFSPEFRNRLDAIVPFKPLAREVIGHVVDKFVIQLEAQLDGRGVTLRVDEDARQWLGDNGYDEKMGARPMARLLQDKIKTPLADELLFGKLSEGGQVRVYLNPDYREGGEQAPLLFEIEASQQSREVATREPGDPLSAR